MRYITAENPVVADTFDVIDTETGDIAIFESGFAYTDRYTNRLNDPDEHDQTRRDIYWTTADYQNDEQREHVRRHMMPKASDEFWAKAQLAAEAAGYCEVFDLIAAVLGGPVREGRNAARTYFDITVRVHTPQGIRADTVAQGVREGLATISGLRYATGIEVVTSEDPALVALRTRMAELHAERVTETAE